MEHEAESQIKKALEIQREILNRLESAHDTFQDPRACSGKRWCDLAAINQVNKLLAEALGFVDGCEGSQILAEVST